MNSPRSRPHPSATDLSGIDFDLSLLRPYYYAAKAGGFAQAALHMGATRASVSRQIATLEEKLGFRLFEPDTDRLTEAGTRLLPGAEGLLLALNQTIPKLRGEHRKNRSRGSGKSRGATAGHAAKSRKPKS